MTRTAEPAVRTLVVLGATGDLAARLLLPGLASLVARNRAPGLTHVGVGGSDWTEACDLLTVGDLPEGTRLVLEKLFGRGLESARALNRILVSLVPEEQVFRVDHWLATPTVVNLLGLRFANPLLEPVWNNRYIDRVETLFDEDLTLAGRARHYDSTGALRDMMQSHLLLLMGAIAMDAPATLHERDVREGCWRIVEPTLAAWAERAVSLEEYPAGSNGPPAWASSHEVRPLQRLEEPA